MTGIAWATLGICLAGIGLVTAGYPFVVAVIGRGRSRSPAHGSGELPSISMVVAARNAQALIAAKIDNFGSLDYPRDKAELVIVSDGSGDDTLLLCRERADGRVLCLETPTRGGKAAALNAAVDRCRGTVLVFSDVDAELAPDALRHLVAPLADDRVGGVGGRIVAGDDRAVLESGQRTYLGWDNRIKAWEGRLGWLTANSGKLYALRRDLFRPVDPAATDDLFNLLTVARQGFRFAYAPRAVARVRLPVRSAGHELRRRRRIVARSLHGLWCQRAVFDPRRTGGFAVALFVNKVMRRLLPVFLLGVLGASLVLAAHHLSARLLLGVQLALVVTALLHPLGLVRGGRPMRLSQTTAYVLLGSLGTLWGWLDFLRGTRIERWEPIKPAPWPTNTTTPAAPPEKPCIAYLMSRFPHLTETFVLDEIIAVGRRGLVVTIMPLRGNRSAVVHPEVERLRDRVHAVPLLSPAIAATALVEALRRPQRTAAALVDTLTGAWGNPVLVFKTLSLWPKALYLAHRTAHGAIRHIHAHFANHPTTVALIIHRLRGIPFSFTAHGSDIHKDQRLLGAKFAAAAFAVTISQYNRRFLTHAVGGWIRPKLHVVPCGVDPETYRPAGVTPSPRPFTLVCVAALRPVKGHRYLLDACRRLGARGIETECHLVGDGPLRKRLEGLAQRYGIAGRIRFHGALPRPAVVQRLQRADAAVLASVPTADGSREGIPVCLMEAMACGLPVVASDLSGIPELVVPERTGLLVPPGDGRALADALQRLAEAPHLRIRMGLCGRRRVIRHFHRDASAAAVAALLQRAVNRTDHGSSQSSRRFSPDGPEQGREKRSRRRR